MTRYDIEDEELTQEEQDIREQQASRMSPAEYFAQVRAELTAHILSERAKTGEEDD